ncbi:hypothetical protein DSL72_007499 [Monilinia vaccinii-corymbosi]|uniref:Rhodopsin domain-containing protein n=1 Tax=Monilinia vaccinii-corymbosi TaxID=61207 RepID=A0A8A3PHY2_9HELO|nr:hypothetical protein DSL72_007499 [Monilinia vaccinii-corymbosi]
MSSGLADLTPEQLAMPARQPPPGVVPNFANPDSTGHIFIIVGTIMLTLMLVLASLRFYTKIFVIRLITWDDSVTAGKFGTHLWDISIAHLFSKQFQIPGFFINWFSAFVWMTVKATFFLFYLQIFRPFIWLQRLIHFGQFVNVAFYISIITVTLYFTAPAPGQTWAEAFLSPRYTRTFNTTIPIASGSLVIPIFGVSNLQLSLHKKFGVMLIFATGLIACIASSLSIYYKTLLNKDTSDFTRMSLPVIVMARNVEMCVGISACCMPALSKLIRNRADWATLRSKLSSLFNLFSSNNINRPSKKRSQISEKSSITPAAGNNRPYVNLDDTHASFYELNTITAMHAFIHGPSIEQKSLAEEGIQLEYS